MKLSPFCIYNRHPVYASQKHTPVAVKVGHSLLNLKTREEERCPKTSTSVISLGFLLLFACNYALAQLSRYDTSVYAGSVYAGAAAPTIAGVFNIGTPGTTVYSYVATSVTANGSSLVSFTNTTTTGNATLSATNSNLVKFDLSAGATYTNVYRTSTTGGLSAGLICQNIPNRQVNSVSADCYDTGQSSGEAPPSSDTSGAFSLSNSQLLTAVQGTAGTKLLAATGAFTPGDVLIVAPDGSAKDGGGSGGGGTIVASPKFQIPYYSATGTASTLTGDSHFITDGSGNMTATSYATNGTTPGADILVTGTGSIPALPSNSAGLAAPVTGGTSYLIKLPATMTAGLAHFAAPATGDGVNETALTSSAVSLTADVSGTLPAANGGTGNAALTFPSGTAILPKVVAQGTIALATAAISSGACQAVTAGSVNSVAVTGMLTTDVIKWSANGSLKAITGFVPSTSGGLSIEEYPTAGNANWDVCNWSASSITPGAVTLNYQVLR